MEGLRIFDKEKRTETPRNDYIILSVYNSGIIYDENEINPIKYTSLESVCEKYFKGISSKQIDDLEKNINLAKNKKIYIKEQFEFPMDNELKQFEAQFIPDVRDSCQLMIEKIDEIRSRKKGIEIQLLEKEIILRDSIKIVKYICQQNDEGYYPTYGEICKYMGITNTTGRKKLRALIEEDYINEIKTGRTKNLIITENGRKRFRKR